MIRTALRPLSAIRRLLGHDLRRTVMAEAASLGLDHPRDAAPVREEDLLGLPAVVQRYLRFMGVVGRPIDWSLVLHARGRFRMRPGQRFMPCEAWQYSSAVEVARVFHMRVDVAGVLPMVGRDTYRGGHGRMEGRLLGLISVAHGEGPATDVGELTTFLNDAVFFAPSMLLRLPVSWSAVSDRSFDVTLSDAGRTVSALVSLDGRGAPCDFSTTDRYAALPGGPVRARWTTPMSGWRHVDGRAFPSRGSAIWHLATGDFTYAEFEFSPDWIRYNVLPGGTGQVPAVLPRVVDHRQLLRGACQVVAATVAAPLLRSSYNRDGATPREVAGAMPGDELVPSPRLGYTRALTIEAPAEVVWSWLVQIGQGRGGLYSFDALENLVGCDIHSADAVLPEHQSLEAHDIIRLGPDGYPCYRVASVDPPHSLVLLGADPKTHEAVPGSPSEHTACATWQWLLQPIDEGHRTRLLTRQRLDYPRRQSAMWHLVEPIGFIMEREMLRGIKRRAEATGRPV